MLLSFITALTLTSTACADAKVTSDLTPIGKSKVTPAEDLSEYLRIVQRKINRVWIPNRNIHTESLKFRINKDGSVSDLKLCSQSTQNQLNTSNNTNHTSLLSKAIKESAPYKPLPGTISGSLLVKITGIPSQDQGLDLVACLDQSVGITKTVPQSKIAFDKMQEVSTELSQKAERQLKLENYLNAIALMEQSIALEAESHNVCNFLTNSRVYNANLISQLDKPNILRSQILKICKRYYDQKLKNDPNKALATLHKAIWYKPTSAHSHYLSDPINEIEMDRLEVIQQLGKSHRNAKDLIALADQAEAAKDYFGVVIELRAARFERSDGSDSKESLSDDQIDQRTELAMERIREQRQAYLNQPIHSRQGQSKVFSP